MTTNAQNILLKISSKNKQQNNSFLKNVMYGTLAGSSAAVATQFIDTVSNTQQRMPELNGIKNTIKYLNNEAITSTKLNPKLVKALYSIKNDNVASNVEKSLKYVKRYNNGLFAKLPKIGLATGISLAIYSKLKEGNK